jgi:alpha/beta superfamily hydrolase
MSAHDERLVQFETNDGVSIAGDLVVPPDCRAATIVCHPHPQYGGNRFNPVVDALHRALPPLGVASLRFDFRADFADGIGERLDALAALDELARLVPNIPRVACGYSFGAMITLSLDHPDLAAKVLIAPPLGHVAAEPGVAVPTLVLTPALDQFAPPVVVQPIVERWPEAEFEVIDVADHFIAGQTGSVADRVARWISGRSPLRSPL